MVAIARFELAIVESESTALPLGYMAITFIIIALFLIIAMILEQFLLFCRGLGAVF